MTFAGVLKARALAVSALTDLIDGRFYMADSVPAKTAYPVVSYQRSGYEPDYATDMSIAYAKEPYLFEIYAETKAEAESVAKALKDAFTGQTYVAWSGYMVFSAAVVSIKDAVIRYEDGSEVGLSVIEMEVMFNHDGGEL